MDEVPSQPANSGTKWCMCRKLRSVNLLDEQGRFLRHGGRIQRSEKNYPVTMPTWGSSKNCICDRLYLGNIIDIDGNRIKQKIVGISEKGSPVAVTSDEDPLETF
ncbi:hypothetical protein HOLleu_11040 [Holothuria leucospilota]|uniref:Uncharacterized protein n=1 Tax=Holothuria leucospilota TaxID=206669 RepID=A0A9Q1CED2_HOLLE|nr:hypothetical protein HOLleu_11040 [Holothuria leucospilota]